MFEDFHGDSFSTATIAEVGNGFSGQINSATDVDVFRINLTEETVAIRFIDAPDTLTATVFNADGSLFANLVEDQELWVNNSDASHLFVVYEGANQDSYQADFGAAPGDIPDGPTTNYNLRSGDGFFSYSHGENDEDWFRIIASEGETVEFAIELSADSFTPTLQIVDFDGNVLATSQALGDDQAAISYTLQDNNTVYLVASPNSPAGSSYTSFQPIENDDFASDSSTTGFLSLGGSITGIINEDGDFDWFGFDAEAGQVLQFTLTPGANAGRSFVSIVDENGLFAAGAILLTGGENGTLTYNVSIEDAGLYYFSVTIDPDFESSVDYNLALTESTDVPDNQTSTERILLGETYEGNIDGNRDQDWIGVQLEAGETYFITEASHGDVPNGLGIYDASGNNIFSTFASFGNDFEPVNHEFTATETGLFFIAIENDRIERFGVDTAYTVEVNQVVDDFGDSVQAASFVDLEAGIIGALEHSGDEDWFRVTLNAYDGLVLNVENADNISFLDNNGNFYTDPFFRTLGAEYTGDYHIVASSFLPSSENYSIIAEYLIDEAAGDISTNAVLGDNQTLTGTITSNDDQDWYAFNASAGDILTVEFGGSDAFYNFDLYDSNGNRIGGSSFLGLYEASFSVDGIFYLGVSASLSPGVFAEYRISTGDQINTILDGTRFDDTLLLNDIGVTLFSYGGDDVVTGGAGDDVVSLGTGQDIFIKDLSSGDDVISDFNVLLDKIDLQLPSNMSWPDVQNLLSADGNSTVVTLSDGSTVRLESVQLSTLDSSNFLLSGSEILLPIIVSGTAGDDTLLGQDNTNDTLNGLSGDDIISGLSGDDILDGGNGSDIATFTSEFSYYTISENDSGGITILDNVGNDGTDSLSQIEFLQFSDQIVDINALFSDTLIGTSHDDTLSGLAGDDTLSGARGDDMIDGGDGNDTLSGNAGNDIIDGGLGIDTILSGAGNDTANGGDGDDIVSGQAGDDTLFGGAGDDIVNGNSGADDISGGLGIDTISGGGGDDIINGNDGDDILNGSIGMDIINGGDGNDTIQGNNQNDMLFGNAGDDTILGGAGNDIITGGADDDTLIGGAGQDNLSGDAGNDMLEGNSGGDDLFGGAGDDILNGGGGNDDLNGGAGADTFVFTAPIGVDRVQDFEGGVDLLDFSGFSGVDSFADIEAVASQFGANVRFDFNANNVIILEGVALSELDASDFAF